MTCSQSIELCTCKLLICHLVLVLKDLLTSPAMNALNQNLGLNHLSLIPTVSIFKKNILKQANIFNIWWEFNISINTSKCFTKGKLHVYLIHYFFLFSCQHLFRCGFSLQNILPPVNLNQKLDVKKPWILLQKQLPQFISNTRTNLFSVSFSFLFFGFFLCQSNFYLTT